MNTFSALPISWNVTRLDRVATVNARIGWKALTASEYQGDGYAFLATPNIKSREIDFNNVNFISSFRYNESPELKLQKGDVLLTKDGMTLGIVNIVRDLPRAATVNGSIAVLRSTGMEPRFLYYAISSSVLQAHIATVKDGMDVPHLFQRDIKRFALPHPPPDEQYRIADFLDAETSKIDGLRSLKASQTQLLRERFDADLVLSLLPAGPPSGWRRTRLKLLFDTVSNGMWGTDPVGDPSDIYCVRVADFDRDHFSVNKTVPTLRSIPEALLRNRTLRAGDVLLEKSGGGEKSPVGFAVTFSSVDTSICSNFLAAMRPSPGVHHRYAALLMAACYKAGLNIPFIKQTTGIQNLDSDAYLSQPVPFPDYSTQKEYVQRLDRSLLVANTARDALKRQINMLSERRQALITAAVTGQFDVSSASGRGLTDGVSA